jgi:hypothetical protein
LAAVVVSAVDVVEVESAVVVVGLLLPELELEEWVLVFFCRMERNFCETLYHFEMIVS